MATPAGPSHRGAIRISGADTVELVAPHLRVRGDHRFIADLRLDDLALPVIAIDFVGPRSYTAEDALEIQLPGQPALLRRVLDALIASGHRRGLPAREAEPGEFTARAFFNGRLSLTEAEGVAATITAQSDAELRAAGMLRRGRLGVFATALSDDLASALALVEAGIDFTDQEDVVPIAPRDLVHRVRTMRERIGAVLDRAVGMEQLEAIPWVVLTGRPNAGKSTLFNALLGRERAVVSGRAGTTRDVLAEPLTLEAGEAGAEVLLVDLAGAEVASVELDRRVQAAARAARARAELVIRCIPVDQRNDGVADEGEMLVRTKSDLGGADEPGLAVSAHRGSGLDELRREVARRIGDRAVSFGGDAMALESRHAQALRTAAEHLDGAIGLVEASALGEPAIVAAALRLALDELASLAGDVTPDDVLGKIFATFCVGK